MSEKMFPIMTSPNAATFPSPPCLRSIPWSVIAPFEAQAIDNHNQTLERLSERGGLAPCEAVAVLEGRRWKRMDYGEAASTLKRIVDSSKDTTIATLTKSLEEARREIKDAISGLKNVSEVGRVLLLEQYVGSNPNQVVWSGRYTVLTIGDLRNAHEAAEKLRAFLSTLGGAKKGEKE